MKPAEKFMLVAVLGVLLIVTPLLAITYGWLDGNRHPNVGTWAIQVDGQLVGYCSGTLIAPKVFLTAGHCTSAAESLGITRAEVTFDSTVTTGSTFYAGTIHTHPAFDPRHSVLGPDPADVGIFVFDDPVVGITPAAIAPVGTLDAMFREKELKDQKFTAVGYGITAQFRFGKPEFHANADRRYAISEFRALAEGWLHVSQNPVTDDGGTCNGDSGGPTFVGAGENETPYIVAITSKGDMMCRSDDVRYRIDTPTAREFIKTYVSDLP